MGIYLLLSSVIFLFLSSLSSFVGSVNFLNSSNQIVIICLYVFLYLLSARFFIKKRVIFSGIIVICLISGGLFILHSVDPIHFSFLQPKNLQFIIATDGGHNHLGDLVGMGLTSLLISPLFLTYQVAIGIVYLFFMVVSFSKSAFLSTFVTIFFITLARRGTYWFIFICFLGIALISVVTYTKEFSSIKPISLLQNQMEKYIHLKPKSLLSSRDMYITQATQSWITTSLEHSFFGFGPGNFIYASNKSAYEPSQVTTDTHNIILTIIIESGVLTAFWFLFFFVLTVFVGMKTNNPLTYLVIYLFTNFQTDYTYRIPLFFTLFFFLSGQIIAPLIKNEAKALLHWLIALVLVSVLCFGIYARFLNTYHTKLTAQINTSVTAKNLFIFNDSAKKLETITPYDETTLLNLSRWSEELGDNEEAVRFLEKLSLYSPHIYFLHFPHLLDLQKKNKVNLKTYLEERKKSFTTLPFSPFEKRELNLLCRDYAKIKCIR